MQSAWDVIIVGGGLAGLSLAVELADPRFSHVKVLVLEQRTHYTRDRTWSYWATQPHRYSHLERQHWRQWKTSLGGHVVQRQSPGQAYCTIDADALYGYARAVIAASVNVQLRMGASVQRILPGPPGHVQLQGGELLEAHWVMDGRPHPLPQSRFMAQHFEGWEIEADCDCFDPQALDLMDFHPSNEGLNFFYVLPYSARRALVETTWVSRWVAGMDYAGQLEKYLALHWPGMRYQKVYRERGILNLESPPTHNVARILPLGRNAGTLRQSTGFAFLNTVADAARIAQLIGHAAPGRPLEAIQPYRRSGLDLWMDQIFLEGLQSDWRRAPDYFMAMFEQVDPLALTAFLSGSASISQRGQVAMSLPKAHFIHAAWRQFSQRA